MSEEELVEQLRQKDEEAFAALVERYHMPMVRLAMTFVPSRSVAEEVVQDTWLGIIKGIDGFEERSSLKTWMYSILVNRARRTGARERRIVAVDDTDTAGTERILVRRLLESSSGRMDRRCHRSPLRHRRGPEVADGHRRIARRPSVRL